MTCEETGEVLQGAAGQINTGRVDKHAKAPGELVILVVNPSARSFPHAHRWGRPPNHPSGWKRLSLPTTDPTSRNGPTDNSTGCHESRGWASGPAAGATNCWAARLRLFPRGDVPSSGAPFTHLANWRSEAQTIEATSPFTAVTHNERHQCRGLRTPWSYSDW